MIVFSASIASSIGAVKSFYNIEKYRKPSLNSPPSLQAGVWVNIGFVDEVTRTESAQGKYTSVKSFGMLGGFGGPEEQSHESKGYDYLLLPITFGASNDIPVSFQGMSGGGLWQVELISNAQGEIEVKELWLSGIVFAQQQNNGQRNILCHFRKSIYDIVYEKLAKRS